MSADNYLVFTGIAPHPPIMVPEVGGDAITEVRKSIDGMTEFTQRIVASGANTVVLISPHAPLEADSFVAYEGPTLHGDFSRFRAPASHFTASVDEDLLTAITANAAKENFRVTRITEPALDHGTAVPLYFLITNGWKGNVVALGYSFLSNDDHLRFGACIKRAIDEIGRPVAFVASGDLSHRLKPDAPAGYNPNAHVFDEEVVGAIRSNSADRIADIDYNLRRLAGECGYRSMLVAIGAGEEIAPDCEVISYEAPFGVGYMVAQLTKTQPPSVDTGVTANVLTRIARDAVESFVKNGVPSTPPPDPEAILSSRAPCFVSLKTLEGELRGCIGTIEPVKNTLAEELVANAVSAATQDPRFPPVTADELSHLRYSVDVLLPAEPTTIDQLDPRVYGVIVEDESGERRGLLLPDISGVDDAHQQVEIATRKAGIPRGAPVRISRFKVERFRE
jgi:AmmeMemoRadiSam system protein A/AmmeMemoRadiSam system protein B